MQSVSRGALLSGNQAWKGCPQPTDQNKLPEQWFLKGVNVDAIRLIGDVTPEGM